MKPIFAVVAIVGFFERCPCDFHLPHGGDDDGNHGHAGSGASRDAGVVDAATQPGDDEDAGTPTCRRLEGLYKDADCSKLADGLRPYKPNYELFADGASKERYIFLPEGSTIDTSFADRWTFPVGTRVYKTFSVDDKRLETRVFIKSRTDGTGLANWDYAAYVWNDDGKSVRPANTDVSETMVRGIAHVVPTKAQCQQCHSLKGQAYDALNGFGAIQLNHDTYDWRAWTLRRLIHDQRLENKANSEPDATVDNAVIPGNDEQRAALGYLHGNCAHCHGGTQPRASMPLWATVGMKTVDDSPVFKSVICNCLVSWKDKLATEDQMPIYLRLAPGDPTHSGVVARMALKQMPPVGITAPDQTGLDLIKAFIAVQKRPADCPTVCPVPTPVAPAM